jgi:hypothetical protein
MHTVSGQKRDCQQKQNGKKRLAGMMINRKKQHIRGETIFLLEVMQISWNHTYGRLLK